MDRALKNIWAKTAKSAATGWHPLILHMLDVAASSDAILAREPETTRKRMAEIWGWSGRRPERGSCSWWLVMIWGRPVPGFSANGKT